jgi:hypothetical protein
VTGPPDGTRTDADRAQLPSSPLGVLQRILQSRPPPPAGKRCEMCAAPIPTDHGHVVDVEQRALLCACQGCRLLFEHERAGAGRYRAVGDRYLSFDDLALDDGVWEALQIPVSIAFFFHNSQLGAPVALYPSPGGATESELPVDDWRELVSGDGRLATLRDDVEALLVRRDHDGFTCYLVPITACYELVGTLRAHWRGFDGGQQAREAIAAFFDTLAHRSRPAEEVGGR